MSSTQFQPIEVGSWFLLWEYCRAKIDGVDPDGFPHHQRTNSMTDKNYLNFIFAIKWRQTVSKVKLLLRRRNKALCVKTFCKIGYWSTTADYIFLCFNWVHWFQQDHLAQFYTLNWKEQLVWPLKYLTQDWNLCFTLPENILELWTEYYFALNIWKTLGTIMIENNL